MDLAIHKLSNLYGSTGAAAWQLHHNNPQPDQALPTRGCPKMLLNGDPLLPPRAWGIGINK